MRGVLATTERLLALLSALQRGGTLSGPALAERLGVTERTIRRDVDRLRRLGYAVESEAGVAGGYRLAAGGTALPPLVLDEEEAVALAVSVRTAAASAVAGVAEAAASALAKLEQVLPRDLRARVAALSASTVRLPEPGGEVDADVLVTVAAACREGVGLAATYRRADGVETERRIDPYRVVNAGRRWYLVARDRDRRAWRTFRLDRFVRVAPTGHGVELTDPPADVARFVSRAITAAPYRWQARVELAAPVEELAAKIPATVGVLEATGAATTLLTIGIYDLDAAVVHLGALGVAFRVLEPDALRERVAEVAARLAASAG